MSAYTYRAEISLTVTPSTVGDSDVLVPSDEILESIRVWLEATLLYPRNDFGDPGTMIPLVGESPRTPAANATTDRALKVESAALVRDGTLLATEGMAVSVALDVLAKHLRGDT